MGRCVQTQTGKKFIGQNFFSGNYIEKGVDRTDSL